MKGTNQKVVDVKMSDTKGLYLVILACGHIRYVTTRNVPDKGTVLLCKGIDNVRRSYQM